MNMGSDMRLRSMKHSSPGPESIRPRNISFIRSILSILEVGDLQRNSEENSSQKRTKKGTISTIYHSPMTLQRLKYLFSFSGFLSAMYFSIPIWMVFLTTRQHFSVETAINLSVLEGAMIAIFEVWSGSWSDRFGRRKIFAIGGALQMGATMIYILGSGLPIFLISALLAGIG